jgi:Asp-tRNA(Asn)/Glu-tRNA(Gln) amidotransferase A subunit family amidase
MTAVDSHPMSLDATAQAALVRSGDISPGELVELAIDRIERLNPELNAVVIPLFEKAHTAPDGPFRGVPYPLKDLALVSKGDRWDLLLSPTMPMRPPPLGRPPDDPPMTFTAAFNVSGQPAVSLPLHADAGGLPIGVQLVAAHGREDLLLRVASQLERVMP